MNQMVTVHTIRNPERYIYSPDPLTPLGRDRTELFILPSWHFLTDHLSQLREYLSPQETEKSHRFRFRGDSESYVVVHGFLRRILGLHLGIPPSSIELEYNKYGKPLLPERYGKVFFSLSHSRELSVISFNLRSETGIDVEYMDPEFDFRSVAEYCFSDEEQQQINPGTPGDADRYYRSWTRKEALLKALGTGFSSGHYVDPPFANYVLTSGMFQQEYMVTVAVKLIPGAIRLPHPNGVSSDLMLN